MGQGRTSADDIAELRSTFTLQYSGDDAATPMEDDAGRQEEACHFSAKRVQICKLCRDLAKNTPNETDSGAIGIASS